VLAALVVAGLVGVGAVATAPVAAAPAADPGSAQNTLLGHVLLPAGTAAAGAGIAAEQDGSHAQTAVDASGAYTVALGSGAWQINVQAPPFSTTSPDWVYVAGPQSVTFNGNPDPISPTQQLDFTVLTATAAITGNILAPGGGTNFNAPNRVWVRAANEEGQGNTVQVNPADGSFSVNVLPGNTHLRLVLENASWSAPDTLAGSEWFIYEGQSPGVGALQLLNRQAQISGSVFDPDGIGATGIPVRAWRLDGSEIASSLSGVGGAYSMTVISGTWEIRAVPPLTSTYVTAQSPQRVILPTDTSHATQILRVALASATVNGTIVDGNSNPLTSVHGRAFALYLDHGRWFQLGPTVPIVNGLFTLHLAAPVTTSYRIGAYFPTGVGYTALTRVPVTLSSGQAVSIRLPAAPNNSTISGHFDNQAGAPQTGLPGDVRAASNGGGLAFDRLNPIDGSYSLNVVSTDTSGSGGSYWWVRGFVDPVSSYVVQHPRLQKVFLPFNNGAGASATANFTVVQLDAWITGKVTDAKGTPVAGALVGVHEINQSSTNGFERWDLTNAQGDYRVHAPAGSYRLRASYRGLIAPLPKTVTVTSGDTAHANLQFRAKNAIITGQVTYDSTALTAFVRAYSNTGAHVDTLAGPLGHYVLGVDAGETWHVQAVSEATTVSGTETVTTFLKSPRVAITPSLRSNNLDLVLQASDTLPDTLAFDFDAS
jgi:Carboxypeptidase regulatory-like domain